MIDDCNDTAHPNGNIFFSTQAALDKKIREVLRVVAEIQTHSKRGGRTVALRPISAYCDLA